MLTLKETNEVNDQVIEQNRAIDKLLESRIQSDRVAFQVDNVLEEYDEIPHFCVKSKMFGKVFHQYETNNYEQAQLFQRKIS